MEVALRRRLAGVAEVAISQEAQTAEVTFSPGTEVFSAAEFRSAIAEAEVEVLTIELEVCGVMETGNALRISPRVPRVLLRGGELATGSTVCVTARSDGNANSEMLEIIRVRPRA